MANRAVIEREKFFNMFAPEKNVIIRIIVSLFTMVKYTADASNKWDIIGALIIGEAVAWLLFILAKVNAPELPLPSGLADTLSSLTTAILLAVVLPILSLEGLFIVWLLSKRFKILYQAAKFALVGALNTFIDLGILNLLILLTGIASGNFFLVFKGASFTIAVVNSYLWNKYWTFKVKKTDEVEREFLQFIFVSVIGFFINVGTAALVVNVIGAPVGFAPGLWANVGALIATFTALAWNFIGYKFWVFKRSNA